LFFLKKIERKKIIILDRLKKKKKKKFGNKKQLKFLTPGLYNNQILFEKTNFVGKLSFLLEIFLLNYDNLPKLYLPFRQDSRSNKNCCEKKKDSY